MLAFFSRIIDYIFPFSGLETRRGEYIIYGRIHSVVTESSSVEYLFLQSSRVNWTAYTHDDHYHTAMAPFRYAYRILCACGESACVDLYQGCLCSKWRSRRRERKSGVVMLAIKLAPLKRRHGCTESASGDSRSLSTPVSWNHHIIIILDPLHLINIMSLPPLHRYAQVVMWGICWKQWRKLAGQSLINNYVYFH